MSNWSRLPLGLTFALLIIVSFFGNVLVCVAVYSNSKLHRRENFYFVSLAGADLLLSVLVMPFSAVNVITSEWLFGTYCKYWICVDILCCTASILHLAAISYDRLEQIRDPLRYRERTSIRKILIIIAAVWATSAVVAFSPLAFDTNFHRALVAQNRNFAEKAKIVDSHTSAMNASISQEANDSDIVYQCYFHLDPLYAILSSLASFYIPSALMALAYSNLYLKARRHSRAIRKQKEEVRIPLLYKPASAPSTSSSSPAAASPLSKPKRASSTRVSIRRRIEEGDHKASVTVGVIVGAFLISWFPFFIANVVQSYCSEEEGRSGSQPSAYCLPEWLFVTLTWMGYANSAQNPVIYSIFNRNFRRAFRRILFCSREQNPASTAPWAMPDELELEKRRTTVCDM